MRILLLQIMLELKLLAKMRWPLLLPLPAGGWLLLQTTNQSHGAAIDIDLYAVSANTIILTFAMAIPILLGVLLIRRDTLSSAYEWSLGLPVSNAVIIASKWIAGFLYSSLFTVSVQAVYLALAWHHGLPWSSTLQFMLYYSLIYEMAFAAAVALGLVLGAMMPLRFSLPIAFCGWVFGSLFVPAYLVMNMGMYPLKAFSLNHLTIPSTMSNVGWYRSLSDLENIRMYPFVALFSLFMLTAAAALVARTRPVRRPRLPVIIMLLTLLLSGISYIPYGKLWMDRLEQLDVMQANAADITQFIQPHEPHVFRISSMKLDVKRHPDNELEMTAVIVLPTNKGQLIPAAPGIKKVAPQQEGYVSFLLDPLLEVQTLTVNDAEVSWRQHGQFVSFEQAALMDGAGDKHTIEFRYRGTINRWLPLFGGESYLAFAVDQSVFLPSYFGWFPLPGGYGLYVDSANVRSRGDITRYLRADFELTASGFPGPLYSTLQAAPDDTAQRRHFIQHDSEAPELFGGDLVTVRIEGEPIAFITTKSREQAGRQFLKEINKQRSFYESWLGRPLDSIHQIVYFPMGSMWDWMNTGESYSNGNTIYINAQRYQSLDASRAQSIIGRLLFDDPVNAHQHVNNWADYKNPNEDYSMIQEIRTLILSLHRLESLKREELTSSDYFVASWFKLADPMIKMVKEAYVEGNSDLVKRVLKRFYDGGLHVEDHFERGAMTSQMAQGTRYLFPTINWQDWLAVWNEEKGR
ncbi:hypothetical protein PAECIP111893_03467 [Paenibacillus plantiphilus]|uniref:ABC transporter permease n=1 Tax=Paenibacillus plantiphilus TaxID=2905650 RepID=A0ABN8GRB3_9BACL|nr:ABC transporter permease [Paenibacillus plantiphilus]CAH1211742.1 hypothetical protein PAECIP111893_03467 [Paenibacillus plantiphilus]